MTRKYTHLKSMEEEIIAKHKSGLSIRETAEYYGITIKQFERDRPEDCVNLRIGVE